MSTVFLLSFCQGDRRKAVSYIVGTYGIQLLSPQIPSNNMYNIPVNVCVIPQLSTNVYMCINSIRRCSKIYG